MRNLLFLAYYFPPSGGVLRLVKLAKYLPEFGWRPLVVCPRPRGVYRHDPGLMADLSRSRVFRTFSLDPSFAFPPRADAAKMSGRRGLIDRLNGLFVPDNKVGWVPYAAAAGLKVSRSFPVDAVFSSAPPYSSHLAGVLLKKLLRRPLVCDFRDAWSQPNTLSLRLPAWHLAADRRLERWVVRNSDLVTSINVAIQQGLRDHDPAANGRFRLLPQGFDPEDFPHAPEGTRRGGPFTIAYTGTLTEHRRLDVMAKAIDLLFREFPGTAGKIVFEYAGVHRPADLLPFAGSALKGSLRAQGFLPHSRSLELLRKADALWMTVGPREGPTVSTSKVYEYLGARKPILASVPAGSPAAALIGETGSGQVFEPDDHAALAQAIYGLYGLKTAGKALDRGNPAAVARYDRREIARRFAGTLDEMTGA